MTQKSIKFFIKQNLLQTTQKELRYKQNGRLPY